MTNGNSLATLVFPSNLERTDNSEGSCPIHRCPGGGRGYCICKFSHRQV